MILLVIILNVGCSRQKQNDITYFEQPFPGDTAVVFAPGIVSTHNHEHSRLEFSKDGSQIFWAVIPVDTNYLSETGRPFRPDEQNIWYSKFIDGKWTDPAIFELTKNIGGSSPAFSPDGYFLYYRTPVLNADPSIRPKPSQPWKVKFNNGNWGEPVKENNLIPTVDRQTYMSFCFADNGNLYFDYGGPDSNGEWWWRIYMAEYKDGAYIAPVKLDNGINDGEVDWCPWVAPDESYLIFSSHREGNIGSGDLYISFRVDDEWTTPANMGPAVNTESQERFPSVSPDGKYIFFARHMPETYSDIFWTDAKIIKELKPSKLSIGDN